MRHPHEAMRTAIIEMETVLRGPDEQKDIFIDLWRDFYRALLPHLYMEEYDLMPYLDELGNGAITRSGVHEMHMMDGPLHNEVNKYLNLEIIPWDNVLEAYQPWKKNFVDHLVAEENSWNPLQMKTAPTFTGRCVVVYEKLIRPSDKRDPVEMTFYVAWYVDELLFLLFPEDLCMMLVGRVTMRLSRYGCVTMALDPMKATRIFVRALHATCNADQWSRYMPAMREVCVPRIWADLVDKYDIETANDAHLLHSSGSTEHNVVEKQHYPQISFDMYDEANFTDDEYNNSINRTGTCNMS